MGSCCKAAMKGDQNYNTAIIKPGGHHYNQVVSGSPAHNQRNLLKQRSPVIDNRKFPSGFVEASTATISEKAKKQKDREEIRSALKGHFLLSSLKSEHLESIIDRALLYTFKSEDCVCKQGDPGSNFYIVNKGKVEVIINNASKGLLSKGQTFGEIALIHDSLRTATIRTVEPTSLWGIDRTSLRTALQSINEQNFMANKQFIENVPIFNMLTDEQKESLLGVFVSQEFNHGHTILREGDPGNYFYIIQEGEVSCLKNGSEFRRLGKGDFFGEQSLNQNSERVATVVSNGKTKVLSIGKDSLTNVLGDQLQLIIYKNFQRTAIENHPYFEMATKEQMDSVIEHSQIRHCAAGEVAIKAGASIGLCIVLKGKLKGTKTPQEINHLECIDKVKDENFVASEQCHLSEISKAALEECFGCSLEDIGIKNEQIFALRRMHLLRNLPQTTIKDLAKRLQLVQYKPKSIIFAEGDPGNEFFIVKEGQVDIVKNENVIRTIGKLDFFGERAILTNELRTATVVSKGASLWVLSSQNFLTLVEEGLRTQLLKRMELQDDSVSLNDLKYVKTLGSGSFGNVVLSLNPQKNILYALKSVSRQKVAAFDIYENIVLERNILLQLDHPFVVKLVKTFKDEKRLYFLMEYVQGQDLFDVLRVLNLLNNQTCKFYVANLILILEHLHENNIIYRDLKPENVIVDEDGYLKLIDFGTAKQIKGRTFTVVGTPHYMAPEVIMGKGYSLSADYWSVGVMAFEFLCGFVPFGEDESDPVRIYRQIIQHRIIYPSYASRNLQGKPIIEQLLSTNPTMRGNIKAIREHKWFEGVDWDRLLGKLIPPPFKPDVPSRIKSARSDHIVNIIDREERKEGNTKGKMKAEPKGWDDAF